MSDKNYAMGFGYEMPVSLYIFLTSNPLTSYH